MKGIKFPESTTGYGKPEGWKDEDCYTLPVSQSYYGDSEGRAIPCLISCWEHDLTDAQIEEIIRTRKVRTYLSITGAGMPPVSLSLDSPFPENYDKELACQYHQRIAELQAKGKRIHLSNLASYKPENLSYAQKGNH